MEECVMHRGDADDGAHPGHLAKRLNKFSCEVLRMAVERGGRIFLFAVDPGDFGWTGSREPQTLGRACRSSLDRMAMLPGGIRLFFSRGTYYGALCVLDL